MGIDRSLDLATPQRSPLWEIVAFGALAFAIFAMSKQPIDAMETSGPAPRDRDTARTPG